MKSSVSQGVTLFELVLVFSFSFSFLFLGYCAWQHWVEQHELDVHIRQINALFATQQLLQLYGYDVRLCHGHNQTCKKNPDLPYLLGIGHSEEAMTWFQFPALGHVTTVWKFFGQSEWNQVIAIQIKNQRVQNGSVVFCQHGHVKAALIIDSEGHRRIVDPSSSSLANRLQDHLKHLGRFCP